MSSSNKSSFLISPILPLLIASGVTCITAGTLPDAPDILPSVTIATSKPLD